ncbi:hypothetical protein [Pseudomonas syringae]|uniref:Uncharacterized protein n=2 Tax=Pseudomonas syringae TaxID=317 RepID=A0A656JLK2_PSESF|nr:hypothetical protein [Pseudomonas syringae]EPN35913.1 hypothetical protein A245_41360 [Pseudomonas syringae pv. actinidiae ICMP 19096]EPM51936.1 hypothetical protein A246_01610 [Pseudomonas syringae pv. actinidiae ICMP 19098]EPN21557.1 hypothetical protein A249_02665 [Pseudomonas syringae pv. actinidiae ICMP 18804]EPN21757.1 hypothetical protein A248_01605 [Pseudomonas syringae pv. actinidiae ICMP 19100]EPN29228.1 hypothetical protein A247_01805 [Pseudomonas syringae pv. actinidiae ICMP 190
MSRSQNIQMLEIVAQALGQDLCQEVAFVGGCTTALLMTDELSREDVRYTDDVDLVVHLTGYAQWQRLVEQLQQKGFRQAQDEVICRMRLGELKVDFMPEDDETADLLGCNNRWFKPMHNRTSYRAGAIFAYSLRPIFLAANLMLMPGAVLQTCWAVRTWRTYSI